jgi:hypothetical protein
MEKLPALNDKVLLIYSTNDKEKTTVIGRVTGVQFFNDVTPGVQIAGIGWVYLNEKFFWSVIA